MKYWHKTDHFFLAPCRDNDCKEYGTETRVPTLLLTKKIQDFSRTFQDPQEKISRTISVCECLIIRKNSIYLQYSECSPLQKIQQNVDVSCSEFRWIYGLYIHAVIVEKCMTFKDIFPGLSRTLSFNFQDYSGPKWFSRTFQEAWEPWETVNKPVLGLSSCGHSPTSAWVFISAELSPTINIFHIIHARSEITP